MLDPGVARAVERAWFKSNPNAPLVHQTQSGSIKVEQGGWIIRHHNTGHLGVIRALPGTRTEIDLYDQGLPVQPYWTVVGWFHTHPNLRSEGYIPDRPSLGDQMYTNYVQVPGAIRTHSGIISICPGEL